MAGQSPSRAEGVDNTKPVLSHGPPRPRVLPRDLPCHSADEPWHLAPTLSERPGQVKPEPRGGERVSKACCSWIWKAGVATAWTTEVRWNDPECARVGHKSGHKLSSGEIL